jgi:tRNA(fMet)-specific endonuclease VapC
MKLLDTSAVVDIDRGGVDRKVRKLDEQSRNAISMVTVTELRLGVDLQAERGTDHHQQALDDLDRLLARFDILPISRPVRGGSDVDATPPTDRTVSGPPPTEQYSSVDQTAP